MRIDMYRKRISFIEESLKTIEAQLKEKDNATLREQRGKFLTELSRLRRLQWEEDHERVNFDDDH
jgi:hypothetical protein